MLKIKPTVFIFLEILHSLTASKTHLPKTRISQRQIYERVGVWVLSSLVPVLASGKKENQPHECRLNIKARFSRFCTPMWS